MNPLTNIKNINKLNEIEADLGVSSSVSWHQQYKDSAYVYIGGLPYKLNEGDILAVFSQYGEIVNINLVRDKKTGKSQGFCFIAYEDQRSTILAVDNLNGIQLLGRTIRVDHVADYRAPKEHENDDEETIRLRKEGCAPKIEAHTPPPPALDDGLLPLPKKVKKEKKSKKDKESKKKRKKSKKKIKEQPPEESSDSSSDEREERNRDSGPCDRSKRSAHDESPDQSPDRSPDGPESQDRNKGSFRHNSHDHRKSEMKTSPVGRKEGKYSSSAKENDRSRRGVPGYEDSNGYHRERQGVKKVQKEGSDDEMRKADWDGRKGEKRDHGSPNRTWRKDAHRGVPNREERSRRSLSQDRRSESEDRKSRPSRSKDREERSRRSPRKDREESYRQSKDKRERSRRSQSEDRKERSRRSRSRDRDGRSQRSRSKDREDRSRHIPSRDREEISRRSQSEDRKEKSRRSRSRDREERSRRSRSSDKRTRARRSRSREQR